ncbi:unnamed protein product [Closterium sp. Naga37s-1]|nr:unnamed protein product [Closterium sp. Naga37s-1]
MEKTWESEGETGAPRRKGGGEGRRENGAKGERDDGGKGQRGRGAKGGWGEGGMGRRRMVRRGNGAKGERGEERMARRGNGAKAGWGGAYLGERVAVGATLLGLRLTVDKAIAEDAEVPPDTEIPAAEKGMARRFSPSWKQTYSWLTLKYNKEERLYGMKCSVCCKFAPNTKSPFGGAGVGARDFQKSACRNHDQSKVHLAAMEAERLAAGTEVRQRSLVNMLSGDPVMARVVKCMQAAQWIAQNDAPIALYPMLVRFMAEQGCPDMMNSESYGRYYSRYAFGEFVEAMAEHLVARQLVDVKESAWYSLSFDESTDRARGKHLIVYVTFERGEAVVSQFLALLSLERCDAAALYDTIVKCLWSKDMSMDKLVGVSTDGASVMTGSKNGVVALLRKRCPWLVAIHCVAHSFKFHYMLYLLADVLQLLNGLNLAFQKQTVDITEVKNHVDKVKTKLSQYYVEPSASYGPNTSRLNKFLAAHGSKDKRKMELKGVGGDGKPAKAEIELHEDIIDPENPGGGCDLEACVDLARRFAQRLIKALGKRMADLRHFDGVGFFTPDKYPFRAGEQDTWLQHHLTELLDMFKNQLPDYPVDWAAAYALFEDKGRKGRKPAN